MTVSKSTPIPDPLIFPWLVALGLHGGLLALPVPPPAAPVVQKEINTVPLARTVPVPIAPKTSSPVIKAIVPVAAAPAAIPSSIQTQSTPPAPKIADPRPVAPPLTPPQPTEPQPVEPPPTTPEPILGNISQILGAEPSCQGKPDCWQVGETQWRRIADTIEQQLHNKGYKLTQLELEDETGLGVYEVLKQGKREFYLHVIQIEQKTVYLLKPNLLSRQELEKAAFES
jgi:hypothetical protein